MPTALLCGDPSWSCRSRPSLSSALCSGRAQRSSLPEPALVGLVIYRGDREQGQVMGTWAQRQAAHPLRHHQECLYRAGAG